jgi:hypothetical protein
MEPPVLFNFVRNKEFDILQDRLTIEEDTGHVLKAAREHVARLAGDEEMERTLVPGPQFRNEVQKFIELGIGLALIERIEDDICTVELEQQLFQDVLELRIRGQSLPFRIRRLVQIFKSSIRLAGLGGELKDDGPKHFVHSVGLFREVEVEISNSDARRNSFFEEFSDHRRAVSCTDERILSRQNER